MSVSDREAFEAFWRSLSHENLTEAEYLDRILGPKYLPMRLVLPLTLVYVTIFITGIIGNVITCTVIIKNTTMHTTTNYYLFSLAISDLTLLILGLPNELSIFWQQYPWPLGVGLCKIRAFVSEMSSYVSVLTIVAFSLERYLAICHPLRVYAMRAMKRPTRFIFAVWLIALVSALPFAVYTTVNYVEYPPGSGKISLNSAICAMLLPEMPVLPLYELSCFIFFILPLCVIIVLYTRMGLRIRSSAKDHSGAAKASAHWDSKQVQGRKIVVRILSAVVIMFFICWAPFHAQRLLYVYAKEADYYPDLNEWLYILSGCLYYFSTTVNPILYNLMSARYRKAFQKIVFRCRGKVKTAPKPKRQKLAAKNPDLCRFTINQTNGIFGFSSALRDPQGVAKNSIGSTHAHEAEINTPLDKPLLYSKYPNVEELSSFESASSQQKKLQQTMSTASSSL
ncbi:neuropeptides capa receptor-like [Venturia canescens]|uniref:neuropeptides capa receptor-like n=1 Tax=Venturia canescens TaxID=32260 RepID=UPI001C9BBEC8|nr:neuropeptides capa receptor-like [Venturia canescens]